MGLEVSAELPEPVELVDVAVWLPKLNANGVVAGLEASVGPVVLIVDVGFANDDWFPEENENPAGALALGASVELDAEVEAPKVNEKGAVCGFCPLLLAAGAPKLKAGGAESVDGLAWVVFGVID